MNIVRPTKSSSLEALLTTVEGLDVTYDDVGASFSTVCPTGYRPGSFERRIGNGAETFARAVVGLRTWRAHQTKWTTTFPRSRSIVAGESLIVLIGSRALSIAAPCRIVSVVDDEDVVGFAYGTLPGHPEQGEESFQICRSEDGAVIFKISPFSRPRSNIVKLAGPFA